MSSLTRTVCACADCVACCKRGSGPLIRSDLKRIADHLGETVEQAKAHFTAGKGSLIACRGHIMRIGTIVTKKKADGSCVFLDEHDRCKIHPVAPFGCAYFDTHMSKAEGDERLKVALMDHVTPEYQALRNELKRKE